MLNIVQCWRIIPLLGGEILRYKIADDRKQEIMRTAMQLFTENGYDKTSLRDIAKEAGIALGLCYHYFDSKQKLFEAAMDQYVEDYCHDFILKLHDDTICFEDKINHMFDEVKKENRMAVYHSFFHQSGNEELHQQLSIRFCEYMTPHLVAELKRYCEKRHCQITQPEVLIRFLTYGQIPLMSSHAMPKSEDIDQIKDYVWILIRSQINPE